MDYDTAKQLEVDSRRGLDEPGVLHPDLCEKITLHGVGFAVRRLICSSAVRFAPRIRGDEVEFEVGAAGDDAGGELADLAEQIRRGAPIEQHEPCPECGRPLRAELVVDVETHLEFLSCVCRYVAALLRGQYALTDEQISALMSFDGDELPPWIKQAVRHASGLPTAPPGSRSKEKRRTVAGD